MNKSIRLEAPSKSGGKFYVVEIKPAGADGFIVDFQHGAIGGNTKSGTKTPTPVHIEAAEAIYQALVTEKMNGSSHYVAVGQSTAEFERPALAATNAEATKCLPPRLLNDIHPDLIVPLTADPDWWIQIKHDGDRVQLHVKGGRVTLFSGRSAKVRACPKVIAQATYPPHDLVLDGELRSTWFRPRWATVRWPPPAATSTPARVTPVRDSWPSKDSRQNLRNRPCLSGGAE